MIERYMDQLICDVLTHFGIFITAISHHLVSTSAIRLALLCENSTNPVVSTIAASTVSIATHQSPSRVESVRGRLAWLHVRCSYTYVPLQCYMYVVYSNINGQFATL